MMTSMRDCIRAGEKKESREAENNDRLAERAKLRLDQFQHMHLLSRLKLTDYVRRHRKGSIPKMIPGHKDRIKLRERHFASIPGPIRRAQARHSTRHRASPDVEVQLQSGFGFGSS